MAYFKRYEIGNLVHTLTLGRNRSLKSYVKIMPKCHLKMYFKGLKFKFSGFRERHQGSAVRPASAEVLDDQLQEGVEANVAGKC